MPVIKVKANRAATFSKPARDWEYSVIPWVILFTILVSVRRSLAAGQRLKAHGIGIRPSASGARLKALEIGAAKGKVRRYKF